MTIICLLHLCFIGSHFHFIFGLDVENFHDIMSHTGDSSVNVTVENSSRMEHIIFFNVHNSYQTRHVQAATAM
uniref:Uncharacterized protein n=1 Tax=Romanomermis culicivorax TaxID=13658 RepID=A0A915HZ13_ROMCU